MHGQGTVGFDDATATRGRQRFPHFVMVLATVALVASASFTPAAGALVVQPTLTIDVEVTPASVHPGDDVTFTSTIGNLGPSAVPDFELTVPVPAGAAVKAGASDSRCSADPVEVTCLGESIAPGTSVTVTVVFTVDPSAEPGSRGGGVIANSSGAGAETAGTFFKITSAPVDPPPPPTPPQPPAIEAAKFVPLPPQRVFDTRPGSAPGPKGFVDAGEAISVQVEGVAGVPTEDLVAVALNVTATNAGGPGFVTVWPSGQGRPLTSSLNLTAVGQTRPNLVIVPVGDDGKVSLFASNGADLLADIAGYFVDQTGPSNDGRLVTLPPTRIFDTRPGAVSGPKGRLTPGTSINVKVAGEGGVPVTGVAAVILNLTATNALGPGFITAWPAGDERPQASVINVNSADETAPNQVIVPVGADGEISLFSQSGADLLGDVAGYVTDADAPSSTQGLFIPLDPKRVFDSRAGQPAPGPKGIVAATGEVTAHLAGASGVPEDAGAVVLNVTATQAAQAGFITAWPSGGDRPTTSILNLGARDDTRPNGTIMPLGTDGGISFYAQSGAHLLADVFGYLTR